MIKLKDYSIKIKDQLILNNVSLEINKGEIIGLLGLNGAGKSTLLLSLLGFYKSFEGQYYFQDKEVKYKKDDIIKIRKNMQILFQNPDDQIILDDPIQEIAFGLMNMGVDKKEVLVRVHDIAKKLKIENLLDKPIHTLSYGQKKKIAFASILVMQPRVILLDEPTAGLDSRGIKEMFSIINQLKEDKETTIIIATHEVESLLDLCSRSIVIKDKTIAYDGSLSKLLLNKDLVDEYEINMSYYLKLCLQLSKQRDINDISYQNIFEMIK